MINNPHPEQKSVPEVLFSASSFPSSVDGDEIRKLFYDLWSVKSLRPLMAFVAHSTIKNFRIKECPKDLAEEKTLKIKFIEGAVSSRGYILNHDNKSGYLVGATKGETIEVSLSLDRHSVPKELIKGTLIHEMHHYAEELYYNNRSLPYNEKDNREHAESISGFIKSAHSQIQNLQKRDGDMECKVGNMKYSLPCEPFQSLRHYQNRGNVALQEELPVRVSECLGAMVGDRFSEEDVFEELTNRNLSRCVEFFKFEMLEMSEGAMKMDKKTGKNFSEFKDAEFVPSPTVPSNSATPTCSQSFLRTMRNLFSRA